MPFILMASSGLLKSGTLLTNKLGLLPFANCQSHKQQMDLQTNCSASSDLCPLTHLSTAFHQTTRGIQYFYNEGLTIVARSLWWHNVSTSLAWHNYSVDCHISITFQSFLPGPVRCLSSACLIPPQDWSQAWNLRCQIFVSYHMIACIRFTVWSHQSTTLNHQQCGACMWALLRKALAKLLCSNW